MGKFKNLKTAIRKKIGWVNVGEFVDDPIYANSKDNWNSWFGNSKFLAEYTEPDRLKSYQEVIDIMKQNHVFQDAKTLIDCGCGTGHLLLEINKLFPEIKLSGSDFSEKSISISKQICSDANFFVSDIYKDTIDLHGAFDVVICSEVLEHLLYPQKALENILKFASPHGKIVLCVPNGRIDTYSGHINFWSPESWKVFIDENIKDFHTVFTLFDNKRNNLVIISKQS